MAFITMMIKNTTYIPAASAIGSHKGDKTHHHDQSILFNNFNVINTMVSNPKNPIPLLVLDVSLFIMLKFKKGAPLWWAEIRT